MTDAQTGMWFAAIATTVAAVVLMFQPLYGFRRRAHSGHGWFLVMGLIAWGFSLFTWINLGASYGWKFEVQTAVYIALFFALAGGVAINLVVINLPAPAKESGAISSMADPS